MSKKVIIGLVTVAIVLVLCALLYAYRDQLFPKATDRDSMMTGSLESSKKPIDPTKHDVIDADFARKMIVHNQQGIQIADIAKERAVNEKVSSVATSISKELSTEIQQYVSWLSDWDETYFNLSDFPEMEGHDMYPTYPGMASVGELDKLKKATGDSIDEQFLSLMIRHHEGANEMANSIAFEKMQFGQMIDLKTKTLKRQTEEMKTMKQLQIKGEKRYEE